MSKQNEKSINSKEDFEKMIDESWGINNLKDLSDSLVVPDDSGTTNEKKDTAKVQNNVKNTKESKWNIAKKLKQRKVELQEIKVGLGDINIKKNNITTKIKSEVKKVFNKNKSKNSKEGRNI